jgi:UDPglucose--hexose-1-phosphate uridylyltransferase
MEDSYHWQVDILPRLTVMAGLEQATGFFVNPVPPEQAAQYLREA